MLIRRQKSSDINENHTTPESIYLQRRELLKGLGIAASGLILPGASQAGIFDLFSRDETPVIDRRQKLEAMVNPNYQPDWELTPESKVISHNNFYEFGTGKADPLKNAQNFKTEPWHIVIEGEVDRPYKISMEELLKIFPPEERNYRLRCVEAWSMNIPWIGIRLADVIKRALPNSRARYVAFETLYDPKQMPGQDSRRMGGGIAYPYVEGLRIDEAMNDLSMLSVGLYGKTLAPQNGAPIRLVVPWKYGFKSIKSIVSIKLMSKQPANTWNITNSREYGFYANVNPEVDHPRWSQASERFIGEGGLLSIGREKTKMFNGYAEEVASLYSGMDLRKLI
ncbi:MAG: protein-methionine-sulfoxide reductase catalytic subunit MsrP [Gammaproteobacteria bacterium]|nr:protein-methionine-sulfoxide reductase catalytic subunit MsrP [Gammaproteobacteria bacterium]